MMRSIRKKIKETPLVGRVIDSLVSSNPRENAPSIQAVLDHIPKLNMLTNSDFEKCIINQKGISSTTITQVGGRYHYFIDMWRTWVESGMNFKYEVLSKSIRVTPTGYPVNAVMQQIVEGLEVGKEYILTAKIDGVIRHLKFIGGTYIKNEYLVYKPENETIGIIFKTGVTTEVGFVKLEEGSIYTGMPLYNYDVELLKCKRYLQVIDYRIYLPQFHENQYMGFSLEVEMVKTPTATNLEFLDTWDASVLVTGTITFTNSKHIDRVFAKSTYKRTFVIVSKAIFDAYTY